MALIDLFTGEDSEEQQRTMDETDRKLRELNARKLANGSFSQAVYDEAERNLYNSRIDVDKETSAAFVEGLNEGVDNVRGGIGSILAFPFRLIPPIGWLLIAAAAFFYFGGGVLLRRKITKA